MLSHRELEQLALRIGDRAVRTPANVDWNPTTRACAVAVFVPIARVSRRRGGRVLGEPRNRVVEGIAARGEGAGRGPPARAEELSSKALGSGPSRPASGARFEASQVRGHRVAARAAGMREASHVCPPAPREAAPGVRALQRADRFSCRSGSPTVCRREMPDWPGDWRS